MFSFKNLIVLAILTSSVPLNAQLGALLGGKTGTGSIDVGPAPAPSNVQITIPANGATEVAIQTNITCTANNALTYQIQIDTVNPPVSAYQSAPGGVYIQTLNANTTYYTRCRATNLINTTTGLVSSFITITVVAEIPVLLANAERIAIWTQEKADYDNSVTTPKCEDGGYTIQQTIACNIYKAVIDTANMAVGVRAENEGVEPALLAMIPGNDSVVWCLKAYNDSVSTGILHYTSDNSAAADFNVNREIWTDWALIMNWCRPYWTTTQNNTYTSRMIGMTDLTLNVYRPNGWLCGDVDQQIGNWFGIKATYEHAKTFNAAIVTLNNDDDLGGYVPSALVCDPQDAPNKTARNMIAFFYSDTGPARGGAWFQGTEYSSEAFLGILGCEALRTTEAGNAPCTEIDTWVDDWAQYYTHRITRNYQTIYQSADNQEPHTQWMPYVRQHEIAHYLSLTGLLPEGAIRQNLYRQFLNFRTVNGNTRVFPGLYASRSMMLANPYITPAADLTALPNCYVSIGSGIYTWNDSWAGVSNDSTQFAIHLKPQMRAIDHYVEYFGDFFMYRKGQYILTHPFSYAGAAGILPEGTNTLALEGLGPSPSKMLYRGPQYQQPNGYTCGSDYIYAGGTTGGAFHPAKGYDGLTNYASPPEHYVDEDTRNVVYFNSATKTYDSTIIIDRVNAKDPQALLRFNLYVNEACYPATISCSGMTTYGYAEQKRIIARPRWSSYLWQWIDGVPTIDGNKTTWTMPDGQIVEDNWLTPSEVTIVSEDSANLFAFVNNASTTIQVGERKNRTTIEPITNVDWNVLVRCITARDSGAVAPNCIELSTTGSCGAVFLSRTSNDDRIVIYNNAVGDSLPHGYVTAASPTQAQATAVLATVRFHKAKTCTIPWTQTTATAKVIMLDFNSALTATRNLDAAGAVAITTPGLDGRAEEFNVSGATSHSLVITIS